MKVVSCTHVQFIQSDLVELNRQQELDTGHQVLMIQGKRYKLECIRTPLLHMRYKTLVYSCGVVLHIRLYTLVYICILLYAGVAYQVVYAGMPDPHHHSLLWGDLCAATSPPEQTFVALTTIIHYSGSKANPHPADHMSR